MIKWTRFRSFDAIWTISGWGYSSFDKMIKICKYPLVVRFQDDWAWRPSFPVRWSIFLLRQRLQQEAAAGADCLFSTGRSFFSTGRSFRFNVAAISLSSLQWVGFGGKTLYIETYPKSNFLSPTTSPGSSIVTFSSRDSGIGRISDDFFGVFFGGDFLSWVANSIASRLLRASSGWCLMKLCESRINPLGVAWSFFGCWRWATMPASLQKRHDSFLDSAVWLVTGCCVLVMP